MVTRIKRLAAQRDTFSREPRPQMDWDEIRKAKARCKKYCAQWSQVYDCCKLNLLPSLRCKEFKCGIGD